MDDTTTILEKSYHPSKNFSYRLPYKVLHMMWDIFNTLDEEHTGFIKKEYLSTALRAAGLIISNSQIEDIIYENKLEDAKEISMDLYFILSFFSYLISFILSFLSYLILAYLNWIYIYIGLTRSCEITPS